MISSLALIELKFFLQFYQHILEPTVYRSWGYSNEPNTAPALGGGRR